MSEYMIPPCKFCGHTAEMHGINPRSVIVRCRRCPNGICRDKWIKDEQKPEQQKLEDMPHL